MISYDTVLIHLRAFLRVYGRCSFRGLGCCSCRVCVSVSCVLFSVGVCVCDLLILFTGGRSVPWRYIYIHICIYICIYIYL